MLPGFLEGLKDVGLMEDFREAENMCTDVRSLLHILRKSMLSEVDLGVTVRPDSFLKGMRYSQTLDVGLHL